MISYKDMTFCASPNCKDKCGRRLTEEVRAAAKRWWGGDDAPICVSHFCDDEGEVIATEAKGGAA